VSQLSQVSRIVFVIGIVFVKIVKKSYLSKVYNWSTKVGKKVPKKFQKSSKKIPKKFLKSSKKIPNNFQVMFPHHSDKMSQRSQVSRVALCMSKVKVPLVSELVSEWVSEWLGHLLSCSGQLKTLKTHARTWQCCQVDPYSVTHFKSLEQYCLFSIIAIFSRYFSSVKLVKNVVNFL